MKAPGVKEASGARKASGVKPRKRRRAAHLGPERRRPQILDAALEIAATEGISAVTIAAVAERLNVTRPVIYSCFADRGSLLAALITREEAYFAQAFAEVLRNRRIDAGEDIFIEGFRSLLTAVAARPQSWRLLFGHPDVQVDELFGGGRAEVVRRCSRLLAPTLRSWGTVDADAKLPALVELWVSAGEGAVRTLLNPGSPWSPDGLGELIGASVYRALRHA